MSELIFVKEDLGSVIEYFVLGNDGKGSHEAKSWNCSKTSRSWKRIQGKYTYI